MIDSLLVYHHLFNVVLLNIGYAYSQQVVMRAGVFSVATAGFAAIGAYCTAILVVRYDFSEYLAIMLSLIAGAFSGFLLSIPLARLRGVYQAIASLAFVEIIVALLIFFADFTGGALGITRIPRLTETWHLLLAVAAVAYLMHAIGESRVGRAFNAINQDETVAMMLGISIQRHHTVAFVISGGIGGAFGGLHALLVYAVDPSLFGFGFLATVLTFIVLGGPGTLAGPIVGATILTVLPEVARPFSDNRQLAQGALMILMILFFPGGLVDSFAHYARRRRAAKADPLSAAK